MTSIAPRLILQLFAKAPLAGLAKTRLIPALGEVGAAALAKKMLQHTLAECQEAVAQSDINYQLKLELWATPAVSKVAWRDINIPTSAKVYTQVEGDLGRRMGFAAEQGLAQAAGIILLGSDCPAISLASLQWAANALQSHDSCMVPTFDGGYALLGLRRYTPRLFADIPWSTAEVASITRQRLAECGMSLLEHPKVHDIDDATDLVHLPEGWL